MVFFNCNACGDSLKKNQVEKHYQFQCRNCTVVSCVDCQKEFPGDTYKEHTKCITEDEKYSGKNWKPKANANKGEQKQEAWVEHVSSAIQKCQANPKLKAVLMNIQDFPNIPRKQAKFENFLRNSMRVREQHLVSQAWSVISAEINKPKPTEQQAETASPEPPITNGTSCATDQEETDNKKQSKRERKEERRKKQHKVEKKHQHEENEEVTKVKKAKKRKRRDQEDEAEISEPENGQQEEESPKKKKKKKKKREVDEECSDPDREETSVDEKPGKFHWDTVVMEVLQKASDGEISLKKLKKKMLAEFQAVGGDGNTFTEERFMSKFNKKVLKNPKFKIFKERIKLRH